MKTSLRLVWIMVALFAFSQAANSQQFAIPAGGIQGPAYGGGGGVYEPGAFQATGGDLRTAFPGRVWFSSNFADRALGYEGSYLTLGTKTRLFNDGLDGRWLGEARFHYSYDDGGFFGNFGIERVFSIDAANADVSLSAWIDYDDDQQGSFAHTYTQFGVSGALKTRSWDFIANGYFPFETQDHIQIGTIDEFFLGNSILLSPGTDSGLGGFDALLKFRPNSLAGVNGTVSVGAYGYGSDLISYVGGGRVSLGMQLFNSTLINAEINYDDRFETTGVVSVGWAFGANARGTEFSTLGRDLEATVRNDHVVRFSEDAVFAINPATGEEFQVVHVDNTADASIEDGTRERPFNQLLDAEANSSPNDIIFVHTGDGTSNLLDRGIRLQNGQFLLGEGSSHLLAIQNGQNFQFGVDNAALRPVLTNVGGGNVVTLANNNTVRSFTIDAEGANNGIFGQNVFNPIIENVSVTGAGLHGTRLSRVGGNVRVANVDLTNNELNGFLVDAATDSNSVFEFENTVFSDNGIDGLRFDNYDGAAISITNNTTSDNGRDGLRLEDFRNGSGEGVDVSIVNQTSMNNGGIGINIEEGSGNLAFENVNSTMNAAGGLRLVNWNTAEDQSVSISRGNGVANFSNNGLGIGIDVELEDGLQNLNITQVNSSNNLVGLQVDASGADTELNLDFVNNFSVGNSQFDGIQVTAASGAEINANILNEDGFNGGTLNVNDNGGNGLSLLATSTTGDVSEITANLDNVALNRNGAVGLQVNSDQDALIQLAAEDLTFNTNTMDAINIVANNNGNSSEPNRFEFARINADNNRGGGLNLVTGANTLSDLVVEDSMFTSSFGFFVPTIGAGVRIGQVLGAGVGINVQASGANNLTRARLVGNTVNQFDLGGINLNAADSSQIFAELIQNNLALNGFGNGLNGMGTGDAILPLLSGINVTATDTSTIAYRAEDNVVTTSFEFGINQLAMDNSTVIGILTRNDLRGNDVFGDIFNAPTIDANGMDGNIVNGAGATTSLSLSTNLFDDELMLAPNPFMFTNMGGAGQLTIALDGTTNGPGLIQGGILAPNQPGVFGVTGEVEFGNVEDVFDAAGF